MDGRSGWVGGGGATNPRTLGGLGHGFKVEVRLGFRLEIGLG